MSDHDMVYFPPGGVNLVLDEENLWQYNGSSWSVRNSSSPDDYDNYKMVYDDTRNEVVLVLIKPPKEGAAEVQTWTYNGSAWTEETSATQPGVDDDNGLALTYISSLSKVYSFSFSSSGPVTMAWNGSSWSEVVITDPELDGSPSSSNYAVFVSMGDGEYPVLINRSSESQRLEFWVFTGTSYSKIAFNDVSSRYAFNAIYSPKDEGIYLLGGKKTNSEYAASVEDWYFIKIPEMVKPKQKYVVSLSYASIPESSVLQQIDLTWIGGGVTSSNSADVNGFELDTWVYGGWEPSYYSSGSYDEHSTVNMSIDDPETLDLMLSYVDNSILFKSTPLLINGASDSVPKIATSDVEVDVYYNLEGNRNRMPEIPAIYNILETPMTWQDARDACLEINSDLVMIESDIEQEKVLESSNYEPGEYWIGVNDIYSEGDWRRVDGKPFWNGGSAGNSVNGLYSSWNSGQPSSTSGYDCGYIREDGTWASITCTLLKKSICELRVDKTVISTDTKTWNLASDRCVELGMSLVKIDGPVEQSEIVGKLSGTTDVWIGYSDATAEGQWRWMSGLLGWLGTSSGTSYYYNNWSDNYPLSSADYDYAYMEMSDSGKWRNLYSGSSKRYICKKDTSEQICYLNGGSCSQDDECCSDLCSDNYGDCVSCLENGDATCTEPSDCCDNTCNTGTGECVECLDPGEYTCSSYKDCCDKDLSCVSGKCCKGFGLECKATSECCSSYACGYESECRKALGVFCKFASDCSTNVCARSQCSCYSPTMECTDNNECCSSNCVKGKCACAESFERCLVDDDCCSKDCYKGICRK
jgi:hypothetical protein